MKKKKIIIILSICIILITSIIVVLSNKEENHKHIIIQKIIEPTCTTDGYTENTCLECDYYYVTDYVEKINHKIDYQTDVDSTCSEYGYEKGKCFNCGEEFRRLIGLKEHIPGVLQKDGTYCGLHEVGSIKCVNCNQTLYEQGHNVTSEEIIKSSCEDNGLIIYRCQNCNYYREEEIEKIDHIYGEWITIEKESCTSTGIKVLKCMICDETIDEKIIEATSHVFESKINESSISYNCIYCNHSISGKIDNDYFKVSFENCGDEQIPDLYIGAGESLITPTPTYNSLIFDGWYTDVEYINLYTGSAINRNTTLYAKWSELDNTYEEYNDGLIVDGLSSGFTFNVYSNINITNENKAEIIKIYNNEQIIDYDIVKTSENLYEVIPNSSDGELYTVVLNESASFIDIDTKERIYITTSNNSFNIETKSEVIKLNYSEVAGSIGENKLLLYNDLLSINDIVVIEDDEFSNIVSYFQVVNESKYETYYLYEVNFVDPNAVFNSFEGYIKTKVNTDDIIFSADLENEIINVLENSDLYKQFEMAQKLAYSNEDNYIYSWSKINIVPKKVKTPEGLVIQLLLSSDFQKTSKLNGKVEKEFTIYLNITNTLSFEIEESFDNVTNFYFILNTKNMLNAKLYVSNSDSIDEKIELQKFQKKFFEIQKSGSNPEINQNSADYEKKVRIGNLSAWAGGCLLNLDIELEFQYEMIGEIGIEYTNLIEIKSGVIVNGFDNIKFIKGMEMSHHASTYLMGKLEISTKPIISASIGLAGILQLGLQIEAGPYFEMGGYIGIQNIFEEQTYSVSAGYLELGIDLNLYFIAGIKIKLGKFITLIDKTWKNEVYSNNIILLESGTHEVPLYFAHNYQTISDEFDCYGSLNLRDLVDTSVVIQDIKNNKKITREQDCWFYLENEIEGVELYKDGILTISQIHASNIEIIVKVIYGNSLIYKNVVIDIELNHKPTQIDYLEPTCNNEGHSSYVECSICKDVIEGEKIIYPESHLFTKKTKNKDTFKCSASCTQKESYWYICEYCDKISDNDYFEVGDYEPHTPTGEFKCTESICSVCNEIVLATKEHEYIDGVCECGTREYTEGLRFKKVDGGYGVSGYSGSSKEVIVPSMYNDELVVTIEDKAFHDENITSIKLPDTIIKIGNEAFYYCSLSEIVFPKSIQSVGEDAFLYCENLTDIYYTGDINTWCGIKFNDVSSTPMNKNCNFYLMSDDNTWTLTTEITIPKTIKKFNNYLFYGFDILETIYYEGTIEDWCNIEFYYDGASPYYYCYSNPMSVAEIFKIRDDKGNWQELINMIIPGEVKTINKYQFYGFENLKSVKLENGITKIDDGAFADCINLEKISIPDSIIDIQNGAFSYDFISRNNNYLGNEGNPYLVYIAQRSDNLETVYLNEQTKVVTGNFSKSLGYIRIEKNVKYFSDEVFYNTSATEFESVDYNGTIEDWCEISFASQYSNPLSRARRFYINNRLVEKIVIPETVTKIGDYQFYGVRNYHQITRNYLIDVVIPKSVKYIGQYAFDSYSIRNIYCYESKKLDTWSSNWCDTQNCKIYWGYSG